MRRALIIILLTAVSSVVAPCLRAAADQSVDLRATPNPTVFEPSSRPYGAPMSVWGERAAQWLYGIPFAQSPLFDPTGAHCGVDQSGPVWYLARIAGPPVFSGERACSIPHQKSILLYIGAAVATYPCPDPAYRPAPGQSLYEFLAADAKGLMDTVDLLEVSLDGEPLERVLSDYRFASDDEFSITGDLSLRDTLDGCITGTAQDAVVDGFFMMRKPLSPGEHTVVVHGTNTFGHDKTFTYHLTSV